MAGLLKRFRIAITVVLGVLGLMAIISGCDQIGIGGFDELDSDDPEVSRIVAPVESGSGEVAQVFAGSPVQILSTHTLDDISRVELSVQREGESEQLIRADVPSNGAVTQGWTPDQPGRYTVTAVAYDLEGIAQTELAIQVEALPSTAVVTIPQGEAAIQTTAFDVPTPTPTANVVIVRPTEIVATPALPASPTFGDDAAALQSLPGADVEIVVVDEQASTSLKSTKPTTVTYPPPPPYPGVPWGPTQEQLPPKIPPVCDAAEFIGVFADSDTRREFIPGPDDHPKKVAGGTIVHRAWKLRNIGTCTWGPGYELAFYGGRSMGSGGVAFESTFPTDLSPRNRLVDTNRLILPEGKPNQIAVLEVLLNVPAYPGIHQSYWRMRNPQGVYFGPIVGVTMEVVRECNQPVLGTPERIYGAPFCEFRILGVDSNLVGPGEGVPGAGPLPATVGQLLTIDWSCRNATNFELVIENPTGDIEVITTNDPRDRANFTPTLVGDYRLTLFAENGSCFIEQEIVVRVSPPTEERFVLQATFNTSAPVETLAGAVDFSRSVEPGQVEVAYRYFNEDVTVETDVFVESYQSQWVPPTPCPIINAINCGGGYYTDWRRVKELRTEIEGATASGTVTLASNLPDEIEAESTDQQQASIAVPPPGCRGNVSSSTTLYGVKYIGTATTSDNRAGRSVISDNVKFLCAEVTFEPLGSVPDIP